ncbi:hypothetical protein [Gorillibacterium sp. sgz5001074]|uniref:hypothetical protein n=1 Tax=Gorillibacterium sp. sgz5001074 TaxID=3446695 RepID=UPI003F66F21D
MEKTLLEQIRERLQKLYDAKQAGLTYGMRDIIDWMEHDLNEIGYLIDDLEYALAPNYPDEQRKFNHEHEKDVA